MRNQNYRKLLCSFLLGTGSLTAAELPKVHWIGTGGTISSGKSGSLTAAEIGELVPGLDDVAELSIEDFATIGSSRMTPELQFQLAKRVNDVFENRPVLNGIVITHGTDSLEETAFLLDLLITDERPVVFAAAQRPPRRVDTDGPRNLSNAVRVAASSQTRGLGIVVTLNDEIHAARDVRKTHSIAVNTFVSPWAGPLGTIDDGRIYLFHKPARRLTLAVDRIEPRVALVRLYAGSDGTQVRAAVEAGNQAVVLEVFGRGNVPPRVAEAVQAARAKDVVIVYVTRTGGGRVVLRDDERRLGVLSGEDLDGLKARLVLVAALGTTRDRETLRSHFRTLSGELAR